jgi:hypothetical protein
MRSRTAGRHVSITIASSALALGMGAGCNLIAGIDEGTLVDARADARGAGPDGSHPRDTSVPVDGQSQHDSTMPGDGGASDGGGHDGGHEAGPPDAAPPAMTCTASGNPTLVDDPAARDAGSTSFNNGDSTLFLTPINGENSFSIVTQLNDNEGTFNQTGFLMYQGSLPGSFSRSTLPPAPIMTGNVRLIDVATYGSGADLSAAALISYGGGGPSNVLALVPVPTTPGGGGGPPISLSTPAGSQTFGGFLTAANPNDAGDTVAYIVNGTNVASQYVLMVGVGPGVDASAPGPVTIATSATQVGITSDEPFFTAGHDIYALLSNFDAGMPGGQDGGLVDYVVSDDLTTAGAAGFILPPPAEWGLLGAKASAVDPTKVVILAAIAQSDGSILTYGATVAPSELTHLTIGAAPFTPAPKTLPVADVTFGGASSRSWSSDEFVSAGTNAAETGLNLFWLSPTGRIVATAPSIVANRSTIIATAVQFSELDGENLGAKFNLVWIEQDSNEAGMQTFQRLYAQEISCTAAAGGD